MEKADNAVRHEEYHHIGENRDARGDLGADRRRSLRCRLRMRMRRQVFLELVSRSLTITGDEREVLYVIFA